MAREERHIPERDGLALSPWRERLGAVKEPRYCDQCGRSLVPLPVPHVRRKCEECGKSVHVAEPGEQGGIRVRKGDAFTIPAGWLTLSLDPSKSRGRFSRAGVTWFVQRMLAGDLPRDPSGLDALLGRYEEEADSVLKGSEKLAGLNMDDEGDANKAFELLNTQHKDSIEWWAFVMMALAQDLRIKLADGQTQEATLWAVRLQAVRSMFVFKQSLEEHVWAGYRHTQLIYDVASASARTPAEAEAIEALRPAFANLSEDVLHAWVESGVDIGPRIGVAAVDEALLRALARYHLSLFERRRAEQEMARQHRSRIWANRIAAASAGAAITVAVAGLLKAIGVL